MKPTVLHQFNSNIIVPKVIIGIFVHTFRSLDLAMPYPNPLLIACYLVKILANSVNPPSSHRPASYSISIFHNCLINLDCKADVTMTTKANAKLIPANIFLANWSWLKITPPSKTN